MKNHTASGLFLAVTAGIGCQSDSSLTTPNVRPDDFDACADHHRRCRDRCSPAGVKEVACSRDTMGGVTKICDCEVGTVLENIDPEHTPAD